MNPLLIFKTVGISVGLGSGITGSIFSSFQAFTKISIEEFLKDDWFNYTDDNDWKLLKKKLDESANIDDKKLGLAGLKEVKDSKDNTNGEKNKSWCKDKKTFKIKKLLPSSFDSLLIDYVRSFCLITIEEKLTTETTGPFTELGTDQAKLTEKANELTNHTGETHGNLSKEPKLSEIKDITKNTNNEKEKALLDWCKSTYKKTYKNSTDNLWKLADHYCKKES